MQDADFILVSVIILPSRFVNSDFTHVFAHLQFVMLMPMPSALSTGIQAVWSPFQYSVK